MSFADAYLNKVSLDPRINDYIPGPGLSLVVAIPACNEPGLLQTLHALRSCIPPAGEVEIIIALNSSELSPEEVIDRNLLSEKEIREFAREHSDPEFRVLFTNQAGIRKKDAGAGFARKMAMDHALSRFNKLNKPEGIILSMDADTLCEPDYLVAVENHFLSKPESRACSVYFEHPVEGSSFPASVYHGIVQYELHLRYYIQGLRFAGHPHAFHTVGSAFCVRAGVYSGQGGMNKRTAGEDFYFLQKIIPLGNYQDLCSTCIIPSPRPSRRVAFGTGPVVDKFLSGELSSLDTYHPRSFHDLKAFIDDIPMFYSGSKNGIRDLSQSWPESIRADLQDEFFPRLEEIRNNSASESSFRNRFFRWFNMFRTLKYINSAHREFYPRIPVRTAASELLNSIGQGAMPGADARDLLMILREIQREGNWQG